MAGTDVCWHAQATAAAAVQAVVAASCRRVLQIPPAVRRPEEVTALAELLQALEVGGTPAWCQRPGLPGRLGLPLMLVASTRAAAVAWFHASVRWSIK
jgi:hypothetical protein